MGRVEPDPAVERTELRRRGLDVVNHVFWSTHERESRTGTIADPFGTP
jgi:hypothetical protein